VTHLEDSKIIDLFFARSEQAIGELDKAHGAAVRKTAGNILRDRLDVEEIVNDTYLGVWNSIPPHRPEPLVSFVCRIARNQAVSRLRGAKAARRNSEFDLVLDELAEFLPSDMDVEEDYARKELAAAINRFLSTLDYDDRYLFVLRYWFADPVKEIAAAMKTKENRVSVRLFRLREKLRNTLQKEGFIV
jgi:RNA polymerase sigma-70 factor (ECF subfamily)